MKKILLSFLVVSFCFTSVISTASATQAEITNSTEITKQNQIDQLFTKLNEVVTERKHQEELNKVHYSYNDAYSEGKNSDVSLMQLKNEEYLLDKQIQSLGVQKIDPNNISDIQMLENLMNSKTQNSPQMSAQSVPAPPNLANLANAYTLYRYQGTYNYQNTTYDYAYIRVIDNKGRNGLYLFNEFNAAPKNATQSSIQSILKYSFGYLFSGLLSKTPVGKVADYTIGAAISGMKGYNSSLITSTNQPFYRIYANATTEMTYYWIYNSNQWKFMGSGATFSFVRSDMIAFNYQGQPKQETSTQPAWSSSSGGVWYDYVENFHNFRHITNYEQINRIGSFVIKGYTTNFTFTPKFATYPSEL